MISNPTKESPRCKRGLVGETLVLKALYVAEEKVKCNKTKCSQ